MIDFINVLGFEVCANGGTLCSFRYYNIIKLDSFKPYGLKWVLNNLNSGFLCSRFTYLFS